MHCSPFILTLVCFSDILVNFITWGKNFYSLFYLTHIYIYIYIYIESLGNESSYWLQFSTYDEHYDCTLKMGEQSLLCELDLSPHVVFNDVESYRISLHSGYHGNNFSVVLDADFMPSKHIRPVPPSNLSLLWEKDRALFQWQSGYDADRFFIPDLQYQLNIYSQHKLYEVEAVEQKVYVDESRFEPHTNYTVRVRSRPDQVYYKGVWSLWTPALHWRSGDIHKETPRGSFPIARYLLLVPLPLVLLFCIPYSRWRKNDYIPSPAPYFRDWDVDVQIRSTLSGKMRDVMQGEESLKIDILTERTDTPPQPSTVDFENMGEIDVNESRSMPQSPVGSEVDSGCWIRDFATTERGSITCSEDYCTLSNSHIYAV
ncbi:interleukin-4 receptor subunit alpha-like [Sinocyclocheilus rhinocerous]|uniref:interleukin-4 receptor subunit alpha-like n=1 Tax=Sinocyclocheilus rhinocerous TaxID=307959 RepID=UPI0007B95105|nr:PREDICTED: interleukin-4 receptor subunit alpha-like [Sinocyclocheilus rhinocerous]